MEENSKFKKMIKKSIGAFILVLIIAFIGLIILRYHVEGEQNMPFNLSEFLVISTAEGYQEKESKENKWDVEVYQTNDIYLTFTKNKDYKETEVIKNIEISNIKIEETPRVGKISIYLPDSEEQTYQYTEKNLVDNRITYEGDVQSDIRNLKISNQGGTIIFRIVNKTGKHYISNDEELRHDGTLLNKVNLTNENVRSKISFDITITLESGISFTGNVVLNLPVGDITSQGISNIDKKDMEEIIFKRE